MPAERIELPVFELPLAALPGELVPLHVFEDRYKLMVAHCIESDARLGILLRTDSGPAKVGCAAEITEVLERYDDGRLNLVATGEYRFRVLARYEGTDFPMGTVEPLSEQPEAGADPGAAVAAFAELLEAVESDADPELGTKTAFEIGRHVELPTADKQKLLESESEGERLEILRAALSDLADEVRRSRRFAKRAQGNGHAPIEGLRPPDPSSS